MAKPRFSRAAALAAGLTLLAAVPALAAGGRQTPGISGKATALEGDLLMIDTRQIRLMGIDAPDPGETCRNRYGSSFDCFAIATGVLRALVENRTVNCLVTTRDRNGLELGECRADGVDLGAAMVARGWAFAFRSLSSAYQNNEAYAQSRRLGLWSGQVEKPWEWRSHQLRAQNK